MQELKGKVYIGIPGFEDHLLKELGTHYEILNKNDQSIDSPRSPFIVYSESPNEVFWYENCWLNPVKIKFTSIGEAAASLRSLGRNWSPCLFTRYRRAALIQEKLPPLPKQRQNFPWLLPESPMGSFTLLDRDTIIASPNCTNPFPGAIPPFTEDREGPPSRAYLKLWEALTLCRLWPLAGERCLDAGASPGGWSWVLAKLGVEVIAVDRAPLEKRVADMKGVHFIKHDAFTLKPEDIGKIDWLFCDVACYPPRLYTWIEKWLASGLCTNFVCTIKMQGQAEADPSRETMRSIVADTNRSEYISSSANPGRSLVDFDTPKLFSAIPSSRIVHLYHNKHELTWIKLG